jgi:FdhD protein
MTVLWPPSKDVTRLSWRNGVLSRGHRAIPEEVPIALTYDGSTYAVMMATPDDLTDFAIGFSITEDVISSPLDIETLEILEVEGGIEARMWLKPAVSKRHLGRRRSIVGPTGCGLCGVDSIAQALKSVTPIESRITVQAGVLLEVMARLQALQALNAKTRAVHAAGLFHPDLDLIVREDVGRHNALDKLVGAAAALNRPAESGIVLLTSRVSVELVQKTARLGAPIIAAISAPTALAVRVAEAAGITLAAILRGDGFEIFTYPERIVEEALADVG